MAIGTATAVGLIISAIATAAAGTANAASTSKAGREAENLAGELAAESKEEKRMNYYLAGRQEEGARAIGMKQIEYNKAQKDREFMANQSQDAWMRWRSTANDFANMVNQDQGLKSSLLNRIASRRTR